MVAIFMIHARRNAVAAEALLGRVAGIIVTDRHGGYNWWNGALRQFCWAHLKRDIQAFVERGNESARIGNALLDEVSRMFHFWHRVRDGTLTRSTFKSYMRPVRKHVEALLAEGAEIPHIKTSKTCRKILRQAESLWTFVHHDGVEPTNNFAERIVRHAVLMRKLSHGTHSETGSRFIERILTVHATMKLQGRDVLAFVRDACEAALLSRQPPSLLPAQQTIPQSRAA